MPKVVGSNPGVIYWMDMTFFTLICCKRLYCLLEKTKNKRKSGPLFKKRIFLPKYVVSF